jgi:hypothetical protein
LGRPPRPLRKWLLQKDLRAGFEAGFSAKEPRKKSEQNALQSLKISDNVDVLESDNSDE